ncbi:hypothetical protein HH214_18480 [Mucilaginibacter robiniae]|uniref:Uncharacterized protein n=1 Tax=Mucilaginibacter robiniae TaxID=2728022 RepID=A0A7L5E5X5_9SPHI|nr:hypothetical protein [Mucilaginibacter robiniae]QJD97719.1 hypothetical protein HH214_18480 [Mucilaginibacter robiniae]
MKPNEETPMDEKTLTSVLSDNVTEIKEIKDFIKEQQKQLYQKNELIAEKNQQTQKLISSFEQKYQKIEVTVPAPSTLPISRIASEGMENIKTAVVQLLNAAFSKNRILVLPEDSGKGFFKVVAKRGMYLSALAIIVGLISWFGFRNWYRNSQNSRYRIAWYWNYLTSDSVKKQELQTQLDSLNVPAVKSFRADSIERYEETLVTALRIKQLERETDSLKALNRKR